LTSDPGLAAAISCLKFGWEDFRTAFWLRRVDPDRNRGRACYWFQIAEGLAKIVVHALIILVVIDFLDESLKRPQAPPRVRPVGSNMLRAVSITTALGFGLCWVAVIFGTRFALRHCVKVWIGPAARLARQRRYWPPDRGGANGVWLSTAAFLSRYALPLITFTWLLADLVAPPKLPVACVPIVGLMCMLPGYGVVIYTRSFQPRVFAATPLECWAPMPDEQVYETEFVATDR
jgi:hypothetical protein